MANKRYQIWDEVSYVITPSGEVFEAEQWMDRYPMARLPEIKLVLAGGKINGAFCNEFSSFVDMYEKAGCDFSNCVEDQDYLDAIELFEDYMNKLVESTEPSTDERIAAALEAQVMLAMPDGEIEEPIATYGLKRTLELEEEEEFSHVKKNYNNKLWSLALVKIAV